MTLARDWEWQDLTGWFWSEKFRGCRACWQASTREFWTRGGKIIPAPDAWKKAMPSVDLDGEIWAGYCDVETEARLAVQFGKWSDKITFKVFDAPQASGNWIERMAEAKKAIAGIPFSECIQFGIVKNSDEPSEIAAKIISAGGEGAMFRNPTVNKYQRKRTQNLLRIKEKNLYAPWRKTQGVGPQARRNNSFHGANEAGNQNRNSQTSRGRKTDSRPVVGLNVSLFPHDPEIDWNIHLILNSSTDFSSLTKRGKDFFS